MTDAPVSVQTPRPALALPRFDPRYLVPMLITLILLGGHAAMGILESPWKTGLAIGTAIGMEALLSRLLLGRWPKLVSVSLNSKKIYKKLS